MRLTPPAAAGLALYALAIASAPSMANDAYEFDKTGSNIEFVVRHGVLSLLKGRFKEFRGTVNIDPAHPEDATVEVTILTASIDTGLSFVDGHLRSPVLFNVQEFPTMTFRSTRVDVTGGNTGRVNGELTLLGITKSVSLDVTLGGAVAEAPPHPGTAVFTVTGTMNRAVFGMDWGPPGFAEDVDIRIKVEAQRL